MKRRLLIVILFVLTLAFTACDGEEESTDYGILVEASGENI